MFARLKNRSRRNSTSRRLALQPLEPRAMMAGDVTATVIDGNLQIVGDNLANDLTITPISAGKYRLTGIDAAGNATTTVNGRDALTVAGVTGTVGVFMRDGADYLRFNDMTGDPMSFPGDVILNGGRGNDWIDGQDARTNGLFQIQGGDGNDLVNVLRLTAGSLSVNGGAGDDFLNLGGAAVAHALHFDGGRGNDIQRLFGHVDIGGNLVMRDTDGNDRIDLGANDLRVGGNVRISAGSGDDHVSISGLEAHGRFFADLGKGDDEIEFSNCHLAKAKVDGGKGNDTFKDGGGNTFDAMVKKNFEVNIP